MMPPLALVADAQSWKRTLASAVDPEATPVNEPSTPTAIGVPADVLPALLPPVPPAAGLADEAVLAADEDEEDEELHPASARAARAARTIAGEPARAPLRRDRVIVAFAFSGRIPPLADRDADRRCI